MTLDLQTALALVKLGLTTAPAIVAAVRGNQAVVVGPEGQALSADAVQAHIDALVRAELAAGDGSNQQIARRHADDPTS